MIVCFVSDPTVNTYSVADAMTKRGWSLNTLQNPPCVHLCVTVCHIGTSSFIKDLNEALEDCREAVRRGDKAAVRRQSTGWRAACLLDLWRSS